VRDSEATSLLRRLYELHQNDVATNGDHPEFCDCAWCGVWGEVRIFLNPGANEQEQESARCACEPCECPDCRAIGAVRKKCDKPVSGGQRP
jgi:hypothetical protein